MDSGLESPVSAHNTDWAQVGTRAFLVVGQFRHSNKFLYYCPAVKQNQGQTRKTSYLYRNLIVKKSCKRLYLCFQFLLFLVC